MSKKDINFKINDIKNAFNKKNFDDVIDKIENLSNFKDRNPELSCLLGVCKILKSNIKKKEIFSALKDFEDGYSKAKKNNIGLDSLCNYISTCILFSKRYPELIDYLYNVRSIYNEAENFFGYSEKLSIAGVKLFKFTLDYDKMRNINSNLIVNNTKHLTTLCRWAFINNYSYIWKQKDYFNFSNHLKKAFPLYKTKNVADLYFNNERKIKIGFVSCNYNSGHSITYFMKDIVGNIDKKKFETHAFDLGKYNEDNEPDKDFITKFDYWHSLKDQSNQDVINFIQKNKIEILIDVMSITHPDRIGIFNNRVSPLQISWLAYCNTVGFDKIDYLIADKNLIKNGEDEYYGEKIIKLPGIWSSHAGFNLRRKYQDLPSRKNKYITFGSFNNFMKISNEVVETWSNILKKVNNSKLILKSSEKYNCEILLEKFKKFGVNNMIEILDKNNFKKIEDHLSLYNDIDIALDTFPYTGVTTTFEALWMGVPVITLKGHNFKSRCGESILKNADLKNLICLNKNQYIQKTYNLSSDLKYLSKIRKDIFDNILRTNLFNSKKYTSEFEKILLNKYKNISKL